MDEVKQIEWFFNRERGLWLHAFTTKVGERFCWFVNLYRVGSAELSEVESHGKPSQSLEAAEQECRTAVMQVKERHGI